jgi:hypothetical protein
MRRFPGWASRNRLNIRVVLVDPVKQQMIHLTALRRKVADAERANRIRRNQAPAGGCKDDD